MLIIPTEMQTELSEHNDITYTVEVTLEGAGPNDDPLILTESDLVIGGCHILRSNDSNVLPLGYVYCAQLVLQIMRTDELDNTDFLNATAVVKCTYVYEETEFNFELGTYTLTQPEIQGAIIELVGYDKISDTDAEVIDIVQLLPIRAVDLFALCCARCGIVFDPAYTYQGFPSAPTNWDGCSVEINYIPEGATYRQLMSAVLLLFGANAFISPFDNHLYVIPYKLDVVCNGGSFDSATPYASGDDLNGGTFNPWTAGDTPSIIDPNIVNLDDPLGLPQYAMQDITVNGVRSGDGYSYGAGYLLNVDVSVYQTDKQDIINMIGAAVAGVTFRPFDLSYTSYPFADLMQGATFLDTANVSHYAKITHIDFTFKGATIFKCTAESPAQQSSSSNSLTARVDKARQIAAEALSTVESGLRAVNIEVSRFNNLISNSFGVFSTSVTGQSGDVTYYLHNKPDMEDSDTIWRMTAGGFAVSTDYGETWTVGIDAQGRALVNVLSTIGLYADWIVTGKLSSQTGNSYWNLNTGVIESLNQQQSSGFRFVDGWIGLYYDGTRVGYIGPGKNTVSGQVFSYRAYYGGANVVLGTMSNGQTITTRIYLNSDFTGQTSPNNRTEAILFLGSARFENEVTFQWMLNLLGYMYIKSGSTTFSNVHAGSVTWIRHNTLGPDDYITQQKTIFDNETNGIGFAFKGDGTATTTDHTNDEWFAKSFISIYGSVAAMSLKCTGAITANYVGSSSDERLKDIDEWDDRYDRLLDELEPIQFRFKDEPEGRKHVGVSAQKVLKALDDIGIPDSGIVEGDQSGYYSVAYNELTTLLIRKVKQQQQEIDDLKDRIERIERTLR